MSRLSSQAGDDVLPECKAWETSTAWDLGTIGAAAVYRSGFPGIRDRGAVPKGVPLCRHCRSRTVCPLPDKGCLCLIGPTTKACMDVDTVEMRYFPSAFNAGLEWLDPWRSADLYAESKRGPPITCKCLASRGWGNYKSHAVARYRQPGSCWVLVGTDVSVVKKCDIVSGVSTADEQSFSILGTAFWGR